MSNKKIKDRAIDFGGDADVQYWVTPGGCSIGGLNGYVRFAVKPVKSAGYDGILTYVPVHGGITYVEHDELGSVYGFDTGHCDSESFPRNDPQWILDQCKIMADAIRFAAGLEDEYLLAEGDNDKRAAIADKLCAFQPGQKLNFGAMINLLCGRL